MQILTVTCLLASLLLLSGCTEKIIVKEEVLITTPSSLLITPCTVARADNDQGDYTVRTLAVGYVKNVSCIRQYELLLRKQQEWKTKAEVIYGKHE
jgi:hypothetical protein